MLLTFFQSSSAQGFKQKRKTLLRGEKGWNVRLNISTACKAFFPDITQWKSSRRVFVLHLLNDFWRLRRLTDAKLCKLFEIKVASGKFRGCLNPHRFGIFPPFFFPTHGPVISAFKALRDESAAWWSRFSPPGKIVLSGGNMICPPAGLKTSNRGCWGPACLILSSSLKKKKLNKWLKSPENRERS